MQEKKEKVNFAKDNFLLLNFVSDGTPTFKC